MGAGICSLYANRARDLESLKNRGNKGDAYLGSWEQTRSSSSNDVIQARE